MRNLDDDYDHVKSTFDRLITVWRYLFYPAVLFLFVLVVLYTLLLVKVRKGFIHTSIAAGMGLLLFGLAICLLVLFKNFLLIKENEN